MNTATRRRRDRMRTLLAHLDRGSLLLEAAPRACAECGYEWMACVLVGFGPVRGEACRHCHPHARDLLERAEDPRSHPGVDGAVWDPFAGARGQWRMPGALDGPEADPADRMLRALAGRLRRPGGRKAHRALLRLRAELRRRPDARVLLTTEALGRVRGAPWVLPR